MSYKYQYDNQTDLNNDLILFIWVKKGQIVLMVESV